jgi:hypothetical protein
LRYYNDKPDAPVFFEIKRRCNNIISKRRGGVRRSSVAAILAGQLPGADDILSKDPRQLAAIQQFSRLVMDIRGRPRAHVFYMREAWISTHDNSVRVTMDRFVQVEPDPTARAKTYMSNPVRPFGNEVILELKFTNRFPDWFSDLVRNFHFTQCGAAKYAAGVMNIGEQQMMGSFAFDGETTPVNVAASRFENKIPWPAESVAPEALAIKE